MCNIALVYSLVNVYVIDMHDTYMIRFIHVYFKYVPHNIIDYTYVYICIYSICSAISACRPLTQSLHLSRSLASPAPLLPLSTTTSTARVLARWGIHIRHHYHMYLVRRVCVYMTCLCVYAVCILSIFVHVCVY